MICAGAAKLAPAVRDDGKKAQRPSPIPWAETRSSNILGNTHDQSHHGTTYNKAVSVIARDGDKALLNSHVIVQLLGNTQV